jgi:hypothetical protein
MFKLIVLACIVGLCIAHQGQFIKFEICYDETGMDCTTAFIGCLDDHIHGHLCDRDGNLLEVEYFPKHHHHYYCGRLPLKMQNTTDFANVTAAI